MLEDFRLKIFLTVAQTGNFTRSSKLLNISQPAVSQNINELEKILNKKLFYRTKGDIGLTDDGLVFKKYAEKIVYWYKSVENIFEVEAIIDEAQSLNVCATEEINAYLLPEILSIIRLSNPNLKVNLTPSPEADIKLSLTSRSDENTICYSACLISSSFNKKSFQHISGFSDFKESNFVVWTEYLPFLPPEILSRISIKSSSVEFIKRIVGQSSEMVGLVPEFSIKNETQDRSLIRIYQPKELDLFLRVESPDGYSQTRLYQLLIQALEQINF